MRTAPVGLRIGAPAFAKPGAIAAFIAVGCSGMIFGSGQFFESLLVVFAFLASISLGALIFVMINHVVGTTWSIVVRRLAEHLMMNIVYVAVLAVPVMCGIHHLYDWSHPELVTGDAVLTFKAPYLNVPFFIGRTAFYFIVWSALAIALFRHSIKQDGDGSIGHVESMVKISAPGIAIYALTQTFAAFDWIMSVEPHWYSTIFGIYYFAGSFLAINASLAVIVIYLRSRGSLNGTVTVEHDHDLGKYIFAFVVFWTYIAFSQYMLIWYANIPEETVWFRVRWDGSWKWVSLALVFGHFVIPFFALMSRYMKRNPRVLLAGAVWMLVMHYVDVFWLIRPAFSHGAARLVAADMTSVIGFGGAYVALFFHRLARYPLVPEKDPRLAASVAFENH